MPVRAIPRMEVPVVKVFALKDHVKKNGFANPPQYRLNKDGVGFWPMDQFTKRRIRDGDVSLDEPSKEIPQPEPEPQPQHAVRGQRRIEAPKEPS
jgi:hypothetical protein